MWMRKIFLIQAVICENIYHFLKSGNLYDNSFLELESNGKVYNFYERPEPYPTYRIQHHLCNLIKSLRNITEPVVLVKNKISYILDIYEKIYMVKDNEKIGMGEFSGSNYIDGVYMHTYSNGDPCDFNKNRKRESRVYFRPSTKSIAFESCVESDICKYQVTIKGEELTRVLRNIQNIIVYEENKAKN